MDGEARRSLVVTAEGGGDPAIARALWMIEDSRRRTLERLDGIDEAILDWTPLAGGNSIGMLLYHIALIEADWLYVEALGQEEYAPEVLALFPYPAREETGRLTPVVATGLAAHLDRLGAVRERLLAAFRAMPVEEYRQPRGLLDYDVTPEWVLHHLMQHEAEHRGEIGMIRALAAAR